MNSNREGGISSESIEERPPRLGTLSPSWAAVLSGDEGGEEKSLSDRWRRRRRRPEREKEFSSVRG
jgi:hypothetical protein